MPNIDEERKLNSNSSQNVAGGVSTPNSMRASQRISPNAAQTARRTAGVTNPASQQPASMEGSTISARQAPIVPKSTLSETQKPKQEAKKKQKIKQRLTSSNISMDDLETINEQNLKQYRSRVTRNRVWIIVLSILLVCVIATIAIVVALRRMVNNCEVVLHGEVAAEAVVDGEKISKFRSPIGLRGNRVYLIDTDVEISSSGQFNVYFVIEAYQSGKRMDNTFAYSYNHTLFHADSEGRYVSNAAIDGGQTINLFEGVVLDAQYEQTLNTDNFTLEIHIYFEKI